MATIPELARFYPYGGGDWMAALPDGWHAVPSWGRDGWDLGKWPLCIVAMVDHPDGGRFAHAVYTEGDVDVTRHESQAGLYLAVDTVAEWYWRHEYAMAPSDLPEGEGLLPHHRGPFSWARCEPENDEVHGEGTRDEQ